MTSSHFLLPNYLLQLAFLSSQFVRSEKISVIILKSILHQKLFLPFTFQINCSWYYLEILQRSEQFSKKKYVHFFRYFFILETIVKGQKERVKKHFNLHFSRQNTRGNTKIKSFHDFFLFSFFRHYCQRTRRARTGSIGRGQKKTRGC